MLRRRPSQHEIRDHLKEVRITSQLHSITDVAHLHGWLQAPILSELIAIFREGMQTALAYIRTRYPASYDAFSGELVLTLEPVFNAALIRKCLVIGNQTIRFGQISLEVGIPITLAYLLPVLAFASDAMLSPEECPVPTEVHRAVEYLYHAWDSQQYPPAVPVSLRDAPALKATLLFVLAHEVGHLVLATASDAARYLDDAHTALIRLLQEADLLSRDQAASIAPLIRDSEIMSSWVEELAADAFAFEMVHDEVASQPGRVDLMGISTLCALGGVLEHYFTTRGVQFVATHPYALVRLLAFEKGRQIALGLCAEDFKTTTYDWQIPVIYFHEVGRVLDAVVTPS
jgi:hypothetical protein